MKNFTTTSIIFSLLFSVSFFSNVNAEIIPIKMPSKPEVSLTCDNDIIPLKMPSKPEIYIYS